MSVTPVSVVIVSRGRPDALRLCLTGVGQLLYPAFEIIVVADPVGVVASAPWTGRIKIVPFDLPNISAARNAGIAQASGDVVAFIDDDAVPEPTWLTNLVPPFADPDVTAAGGFVRGRNGITFQWKARDVRPDGSSRPLDLDETRPTLLTPRPGQGVKTEGTNMAFRRAALAGIGGFDPVFAFYFDETDLNMRLADQSGLTAIVPLAQVHHGYAASERRADDRAPRDLFQIGASLAVYLRKHLPDGDHGAICRVERDAQRRRVLAHMVAGRLAPGEVRRLLAGFDLGWQDGRARSIAPLPPLPDAMSAFLPFAPAGPDRGHLTQSGWRLAGRRHREAAKTAVAAGHRVSIYLLSMTARYHRIWFHPDGYWLHTGGLFGRSNRDDPLWRFWRFSGRVEREAGLVAQTRGIG